MSNLTKIFFISAPNKRQRKKNPQYVLVLVCFKLHIIILVLLRYSLSFWPLGTFDLLVMQICHPQEIFQSLNQNPPNNTAVEIHNKWILDKE